MATTMNHRVLKVLNGYINLTSDEKAQVRLEIEEMERQRAKGFTIREDSIRKGQTIALGPLSGGCPCCGR